MWRSQPRYAPFLYVAGVLVFSLMDASAKYLSELIPLVQVITMRVVFAFIPVLFLVAYEARKNGALKLSSERRLLQLVHGLLVVVTNITFVGALSLLPLADLVALTLIAPLLMVAMGVVWLKEPFQKTDLMWSGLGLLGVLFIVRPSGELTSVMGVVLALSSAFFYALGSIVTKLLSDHDSAAITSLYSNVIFALVLLVWLFFSPWQPMTGEELGVGALVGIAGGLGNILVIAAFALGAVSRLAALDYTAYVWALLFGFLIFSEVPAWMALIGAGLIVFGGYKITISHKKALE